RRVAGRARGPRGQRRARGAAPRGHCLRPRRRRCPHRSAGRGPGRARESRERRPL
ncbi:MAG: hypothetical protein AVDCRST_MAG35-1708, partial [uncultured Quadrisphaera sp.]